MLLVEGNPKAARRFAGEWMHPPGVRKLTHLGIDTKRITRASGTGFVLFAKNEEPVQLPYDRGSSLARVHHELVEELRQAARGQTLVEYREDVSFAGFDGEAALLHESSGRVQRLLFDRVIGADGRNSKVRAALGQAPSSTPISYMMGVDLKDCRLPFEGLGHVIAGGLGPALLYRIDDSTVRACLDVPNWLGPGARKKQAVRDGFRSALPPQLTAAFEKGLENATPWAATRFQARTFFGRGRVWLAGDAVGHLHPVTGMGMTLGILDAAAAAESATLLDYENARQSYVVELLTKVLYHVLQREDDSARRVRRGLFEMLRESANERRRTMRILTSEDERRSSFVTAFVKASGYALRSHLRQTGLRPSETESVLEDLTWLKWPMSALVPDKAAGSSERGRRSFFEPLPSPKTYGRNRPLKASPL